MTSQLGSWIYWISYGPRYICRFGLYCHARGLYKFGFQDGYDIELIWISRANAFEALACWIAAWTLQQLSFLEVQMDRVVHSFTSPPCEAFISSPLGVIPKKELGSFGVIHDLSYPKGKPINDLIPNSLTSVSYKDFDHMETLLHRAREGASVANVDIHSAFWILPIHPS